VAVALDDLRIIMLNERESGRLSEVPPNLHDEIRGHVASLQEQVYGSADPFSDKAQTLIEEVKAVLEVVNDIFRIRSRKILSLALVQVEANATDREELKKMLPAEREMFDGIIRELEKGKAALSAQVPRGAPTGAAPVGVEVPGEHGTPGTAEAPQEPVVLVRILSDMEPFMGVDGRIYRLKAEDVVTLPSRNAGVLIDRNIALNIMPEKLV
jgi:DNA replication factor GINS